LINIKDYNQKQINLWVPKEIDFKKWKKRFKTTKPKTIKYKNKIVGFFEFDIEKKYIDCFYVKDSFQSKGVGNFMIKNIEKIAKQNSIKTISTHSSITAKSFF